MRHQWTIALLVVVLLLSSAFAASPEVRVRARPGSSYMVLFDPSRIATLEGTVERLYVVPSPKVWLTSVNALLRTAQGEVKVELGPSWFLDNQELHLEVGDRLTVTGSQIKNNGVESLIATEVRRNHEVLQLRATDGMPVWVGWRWSQAPQGASR